MTRVLQEPLLHFLLIGVGLFVLYDQLNEDNVEESRPQQIVVSAGRIEQLVGIYTKTWQRPPGPAELKGLIDDFVLEEAYYRQAVEMGLDRDDTIVRRRLRQKLEFLTGDTAALIEPSEEQLQTCLTSHEEAFRESGVWTFDQVCFNPEKHGENPAEWVADQLDAFRSGEVSAGDSNLLPERFELASRRAIAGMFGTEFADQLAQLEAGTWQGPVRSGLGYHLVRIESFREGRLPELNEIRDVVLREWHNEQRLAVRREMNESLLEQYDVVVEWPEDAPEKPASAQDGSP